MSIAPMRHAKQRPVGSEHEHRRMQQRIVGQLPLRTDPHTSICGQALGAELRIGVAHAKLDRDVLAPLGAEHAGAEVFPVRESLRARRIRHAVLVGDAVGRLREARRRDDRHVVALPAGDSPGAEAPSVAQALDGELERQARASGAQERRVERVEVPALDGPADGDRRLREEQATKQPLRARAGARAERITADRFEVEAADEARERIERLHAVALSNSGREDSEAAPESPRSTRARPSRLQRQHALREPIEVRAPVRRIADRAKHELADPP
jgi:hypothetical protein